MEYFNDITRELDKHIKDSNKPYCYDTHIVQWADDNLYIWCIRVPGATRGYIKVDKTMKILEIQLYNDVSFSKSMGCYLPSAKDVLNKFIGQKLVFDKVP